MRNPERNIGVFLDVSRLERDGNAVRLIGTRMGQKTEQVLLAGSYDKENDLVIAGYGGNYADRVLFKLQQEYVPNYILPAVREAGEDPKTAVKTGDFKTPYGRPPTH